MRQPRCEAASARDVHVSRDDSASTHRGSLILRLPDSWIWDFWLADDGQRYHLFFLYASRALADPDRRHRRAAIGHAVSEDLFSWERVTDAVVRSDAPAFDDLATWTGSVVRHPGGTWFLFYTGSTAAAPASNIQTVGFATSTDLMLWQKNPTGAVLGADPQWYEVHSDGTWHEEAFRDPWVFPDPAGDGWHMLITARANHGRPDERGVVGHAVSSDLRTWTLGPPLSEPGQGFGHLEVMQTAVVDGRNVLVFSGASLRDDAPGRLSGTTSGGTWAASGSSLLGPYDIAGASQLTDQSLYAGRLICERATGRTLFLAFANQAQDGTFIGELADPQSIGWHDGQLVRGPWTPGQPRRS